LFGNFFRKRGAVDKHGAIESKSASYSLVDPTSWPGYFPASSGVSVTPETALNCAAVNCAVRVISEAIGQLPILVYRRKADGSKERAPDHPAYKLLHDQSNDWTPAPALKVALMRDAMLYGSGFAWIDQTSRAVPLALFRLDPKAVTVERDSFTGEPVYFLSTVNGRTQIARTSILHIPAPGGESLIHRGSEAIGLAMAMQTFAAKLFGNNAMPAGVITFPKQLTPGSTTDKGADVTRKIGLAWKRDTTAGSVPVLDGGGKFEPFSFSPVDAQFLELSNRNTIEIARLFRVPPHMLFELGRATWANAEAMGAEFVQYSLNYWLETWQGEIALKLFADGERDDLAAEFLLDAFLKGDTASRYDAYSKAISSRFMSPNEVRARENLPPFKGGDKFENPNTSSSALPAPLNDNPDPTGIAA